MYFASHYTIDIGVHTKAGWSRLARLSSFEQLLIEIGYGVEEDPIDDQVIEIEAHIQARWMLQVRE